MTDNPKLQAGRKHSAQLFHRFMCLRIVSALRPGYWKNQVFVPLLTATNQGQSGAGTVSSIAIQGTDVYVAGIEYQQTSTGSGAHR
jgi:hypothetical protein